MDFLQIKINDESMNQYYSDWKPKLSGDVGRDLMIAEDLLVPPHSNYDLNHGISIKLPSGCWAQITARSSAWRNHKLIVIPGVIDEGYVGPLFTFVINMSDSNVMLTKGMSISQLILHKAVHANPIIVDSLESTERGDRGWGSTNSK